MAPPLFLSLAGKMKRESSRRVGKQKQQYVSNYSSWSLKVRINLVKALKRYSIDEIKENTEKIFPAKSAAEITCFLKKLKYTQDLLVRVSRSKPDFKYFDALHLWAQLMCDLLGDQIDNESSVMIGKLVSMIGEFDISKGHEKSCGVNYRLIYDYLACLLMGSPVPELQPLESAIILELLEDMVSHLSKSDLEAHKKLMLWKYEALTSADGSSNKLQIEKALENDFTSMDMSDLPEHMKKLLIPNTEPLKNDHYNILRQLLNEPKVAIEKPISLMASANHQIEYNDKLLPDGTVATIVKLRPIVSPQENSASSKTSNRPIDSDIDTDSPSTATTSKPCTQKKRRLEVGESSQKFLRTADGGRKQSSSQSTVVADDDRSEPSRKRTLMFMPDILWVNPLCVPPHMANLKNLPEKK